VAETISLGIRRKKHHDILLAVPHTDHCLVIGMRMLAMEMLVAVTGKLAAVTGTLAVVIGKIDFAKVGVALG